MPERELDQVADKLLDQALMFHHSRTQQDSAQESLLMSSVASNRATLSIAVSLREIAGLLKQLVPTPEKTIEPSLCDHIVVKSANNSCCFMCGITEQQLKENGLTYRIV